MLVIHFGNHWSKNLLSKQTMVTMKKRKDQHKVNTKSTGSDYVIRYRNAGMPYGVKMCERYIERLSSYRPTCYRILSRNSSQEPTQTQFL